MCRFAPTFNKDWIISRTSRVVRISGSTWRNDTPHLVFQSALVYSKYQEEKKNQPWHNYEADVISIAQYLEHRHNAVLAERVQTLRVQEAQDAVLIAVVEDNLDRDMAQLSVLRIRQFPLHPG